MSTLCAFHLSCMYICTCLHAQPNCGSHLQSVSTCTCIHVRCTSCNHMHAQPCRRVYGHLQHAATCKTRHDACMACFLPAALSSLEEEIVGHPPDNKKAGMTAGIISTLGIVLLLGGGYMFKDQIRSGFWRPFLFLRHVRDTKHGFGLVRKGVSVGEHAAWKWQQPTCGMHVPMS